MTQSSRIFALTGPSALSTFRAARLLAAVQTVDKSADSLSGRFVHFIHTDRPLDESERARLEALLDYGDSAKAAAKGAAFLVVPRLGTISPWSSKATDIAHNTGLTAVQRIERGTLYTIGLGRRTLSADATARMAALLHDRMTESVIDPDADPALLFRELDSQANADGPAADARARGTRTCQCRNGTCPVSRRNRLSVRRVHADAAQSDRRRADDVCAGQLGALSTQDFQRHVDNRRRAQGCHALRHDPRDA